MGLAKRSRNRQLAIKNEAADGTPVLGSVHASWAGSNVGYAAADVVPDVFDIEVVPDWEHYERTDMRGDLMRRPGIVTLKPGGINFKILVGGSGTAGTAPAQSIIWQLCGLAETADPGIDVDFRRAASDTTGRTLAAWMDGNLYVLAGCRANGVLQCNDGEPMILEVSARGIWVEQQDQATAVAPAAYTIKPPSFKNVGLTIDPTPTAPYSPVFATMTVDLGHNVVLRKDANQASGYKAGRIQDAKPTIKLDPELDDVGTLDWLAKWDAKAIETLACAVGTAGGNRLSITAQVSPMTVGFGDRDGLDTSDIDFEVVANADDTEGDDLQFIWD